MPEFEWGKDSTPVKEEGAQKFEWGKDSTPVEQPSRLETFGRHVYKGIRSTPSALAATPKSLLEMNLGGTLDPTTGKATPYQKPDGEPNLLDKAVEAPIEGEKALRERGLLPDPEPTPEESEAQQAHPVIALAGELTGAAVPALLSLGKSIGAKRLASMSERLANVNAIRSADIKFSQLRKALSKEVGRATADEAIQGLGATFREAVPPKPLESVSGLAERSRAALNEAGEKIGQARQIVDQATENMPHLRISGADLAKQIRQTVLPTFKTKLGLDRTAVAPVESAIEALESAGQSPLKYGELAEDLRAYGKNIDWGPNPSPAESAKRSVYGAIRESMDNGMRTAVEEVAGGHVADTLLPDYLKDKKTYDALSKVASFAEENALRQTGNRAIGMSSMQAGQAGAVAGAVTAGHPGAALGAAGGALFNKLATERGSSTLAYGFGKLGQLGKFLSTPEKMLASPSLRASRYMGVLLQAKLRGPDALAVTHYKLSENPDYQQLARTANQEGE